jgi:hypothetical protein
LTNVATLFVISPLSTFNMETPWEYSPGRFDSGEAD